MSETKIFDENVDQICFSPDEKQIALQRKISDSENNLIIYDIKSNKIVLNKYTDMDLRCWHQSGELLLTDNNGVYLAESLDEISRIYDKYLDDPVLSPDKRFLAYNLPGIFIHEKEGYNGTEDFGLFVIDLNNKKTMKMPLIGMLDQYPFQWIMKPQHYNPDGYSIYNTCVYEGASMEEIFITQAKSSSTLLVIGNSYEDDNIVVDNIIDKNVDTAWAEGKSDEGIGEVVKVVTYKYKKGSLEKYEVEKNLSGLRIINGYSKSEEAYFENNRVRKIKLEFSNGECIESELNDNELRFQTIEFEKPISTRFVKITILDVYKGSKYNDTYISEVELF